MWKKDKKLNVIDQYIVINKFHIFSYFLLLHE